MFYFEDTTRVEDVENSDDRLIILDGTARLDYIDEPPQVEEKADNGIVAKLRNLFS